MNKNNKTERFAKRFKSMFINASAKEGKKPENRYEIHQRVRKYERDMMRGFYS